MSQPTYQEMSEVYNAVVGVSTFKKLMEKNKKLEREVRSLKNILYSIPEFRCKCVRQPKEHRRSKLRKEVEIDVDNEVVVIKTEKTSDPVVVIVIDDDDVPAHPSENVLMKISEKSESVSIADQEEVVEDDNEEDVEEEADDVVPDEGSAGNELDEVVEEEGSEVVEEEGSEVVEEEGSEVVEEEGSEVVEEEGSEVVEEEGSEVVEEEGSEVVEEEEEGEESEVFEITIGDKSYYTNDEINGSIYAVDANEEVGDEVGVFVNRKPTFKK